ncbi:hypothetical protein MOBT1_002542 [Malassezia obtusa]|uniref:Fungal lipase-type domain-containing protein n=1 Tax=Malassezia obtusa TaxID=76774 RepID=A0AAF0E2G4_9BASI|nr:hypothetical protein MOBT1_002542 [Malassezia obtusa]
MRFLLFLLLSLTAVFAISKDEAFKALKNAKNHDHQDAPSSNAQPRDIPVDWHVLSQAAGMAQQDYCLFQRPGQEVGDAELLYEYGDGNFVQRALIFKSKALGITVSFEGTEPISALGFQEAYLAVSQPILHKVRELCAMYKEPRVTVTGHSLGAGMALIAAAHYNHVLDQGLHMGLVFGLPRTGNLKFANFIDQTLKGKFYYITNGRDPVPHVPPRLFGYQHPSGQIWINPKNTENWHYYPGQENVHGANSLGLNLDFSEHSGIYFHTGLGHGWGTGQCPAVVNNKY